jgi:group I intron endonuclease
MKISGIYKIVNEINGKYYVGSSINVYRRWNEHRSELKRNIHKNQYLQNSWNKYGENNFKFIIIEIVDSQKLLTVEQKYLDEVNKNVSYNIGSDATSSFLGKSHSIESKEKNRLSHLGKYAGSKNPNYGKKHSNDIRIKISKALKGKYCGNKSWRFGKSHTEKSKEQNRIKHINPTIFNLKNIKTNEIFSGTRYEFIKKFKIFHIHRLVDGRLKTCGGWMLTDFR